jgi:hypothetical protein
MTEIALLVTDDRSFPAAAPFRLLLGTPLQFDRSPQQVGRWWAVTVAKSPRQQKPVTFHYHEHADAVLLIAKISSIINQTNHIPSDRMPSTK